MEDKKKLIFRIARGNLEINSLNIIIKKKNYGKFKYKNEEKKITILGLQFVKNNNQKCKLVLNNKRSVLVEYIEEEVINKEFTIKLIILDDLVNLSSMFYEIKDLLKIKDMKFIKSNKLKEINYLFYCCSSLESLPDISIWNTENIINMKYLFYKCSSIKTLPDLSKWKINKVTDISYLFYGCSK